MNDPGWVEVSIGIVALFVSALAGGWKIRDIFSGKRGVCQEHLELSSRVICIENDIKWLKKLYEDNNFVDKINAIYNKVK